MNSVQTPQVEITQMRTQIESLQEALATAETDLETALVDKEKYRAIFNHARDAILLVHPESDRIIEANAYASDMLGYDHEILLQQPISAIHPDDMDALVAFTEQVYKNDGGWTNELSCRTQAGERLSIEVSASAIYMHEQRYIIVIMHDISERNRKFKWLRTMNQALEAQVAERTASLQTSNARLQSTLEGAVYAMSQVVELRDPYTAGHQQRVGQLARAIAERMALPERTVEGIYMIGLIHDIGKIVVPAEILAKPGKLSELEFSMIKEHARVGAEIMQNVDFDWPVSQVIVQHHERLDGSGYPNGLKGDEIRLEARILSVADVVDAICSHRPYRPAHPVEVALDELRNHAGERYDAQVVATVLELFDEGFEFE